MLPSKHAASAWPVHGLMHIGWASVINNSRRMQNETSAHDGILVRRPAMINIHDFMLPMVSYEAYLSLHLFGAEFIFDGGPY